MEKDPNNSRKYHFGNNRTHMCYRALSLDRLSAHFITFGRYVKYKPRSFCERFIEGHTVQRKNHTHNPKNK